MFYIKYVSVRLAAMGVFILALGGCSTITVYRNPLPEGSPGTAILQATLISNHYSLWLRKGTTCEKNWVGMEHAQLNSDLLFERRRSIKSHVVPADQPLHFLYSESDGHTICRFLFSAVLESGKTYEFLPVRNSHTGLFGEQVYSGCGGAIIDLTAHKDIPLVPERWPTTLEACGSVSRMEKGLKEVDRILKKTIGVRTSKE